MKISEKQLAQLLLFCNQLVAPGAMLNEVGRDDLKQVLANIANQQSSELKELDDKE